MTDGALTAEAAARHPRDPEVRVAQEAADAYERSRIGGLFFIAVWGLMCATAGEGGAREWSVGLAFLLLAAARPATRLLIRPGPRASARQLHATLTVMIATMAAWGGVTAFTLLHPDFVETTTVILFASSAFTTAYVHSYPMRLVPAYAGLVAGYGPVFIALLASGRPGSIPIAIGVLIHFAYLVLAARRAHFEYHRRIDLELELRAQRDLFSRRSRVDALTGIANRGEFNERLTAGIAHARETGSPLSLMIVDIDHFKDVNDERGHATGDECLVAIAGRMRASFPRPEELIARLGGEEFAVLIGACQAEEASARAEAFRAALEASPLSLDRASVPITVSIGVGEFLRDLHPNGDALYRAVDLALYRAKREGRNRVAEVGHAETIAAGFARRRGDERT